MAGITKGRSPRLRQLSSHVTRSVPLRLPRRTQRERERERGATRQGLARKLQKRQREGEFYTRITRIHANYANCVIASRLQSRRMAEKREKTSDRTIQLLRYPSDEALFWRKQVAAYVSLAKSDGRSDLRLVIRQDQPKWRTLTDTETAA